MARLEASCLGAKVPEVSSYRLRGAIAMIVACSALPAMAQEDARSFSNPPDLQQEAPSQAVGQATLLMRSGMEKAVTKKLSEPAPRAGKERQLILNIGYTTNRIYNPTTKSYDQVKLRSYTGTDVNPHTPFVAPTINATPGDTVRVTLNNNLPKDPSCTDSHAKVDKPHCFNGTNLHSHGLWVSPTGNSDNVLLSINPGVSFQYEYNIPEDHPAGTFWYHPHRHGSTALQVGSGMAGALVIHGDRKPTPDTNGDIDTLLKGVDGKAFTERLLVLQQIPYACTEDGGKTYNWNCAKGQTGIVESYEGQFGPSDWQNSGRYTTINGKVQPIFSASSGAVERWRLVHAGIRDTIVPQFRKMAETGRQLSQEGISAADSESFVAKQCIGEPVPFQVIASDGLTMDKAQQLNQVTLQPGYRNDLLVMFPEPGRYCLVDKPETKAGSVNQTTGSTQLLGFVDVGAGPAVKDIKARLTTELVAAAKRNMPANVQKQVIADLENGLKLTRFIPHQSISDEELKKSGNLEQNLVFMLNATDKKNVKFAVGTTAKDAVPYEPDVINRQLTLGTAETWTLQSAYVSHPFHIHVNPFQIEKIIGPDGTDLSEPGAVDKTDNNDTQYAGLKGVWKDTLFVKGPSSDDPNFDPVTNTEGLYKIYVRTRYQRYIGEFVLHCHILDHEDQGMMQNVNISMPDGNGGNLGSGSHH
ncbi:multicopper oxidase family protein [Pseudomonas sp. NPDC089734]|uniref:multicopper oxidase family protein n=1 Tax=Pseudomonas sp. NPDC089734 TaxID=3364469 RepID=UPI00381649A3